MPEELCNHDYNHSQLDNLLVYSNHCHFEKYLVFSYYVIRV
jgi:hypothetical protein